MSLKYVAVLLIGVALSLVAGGCAAAAAGTAAGIASAISTGGDVYRLGKLDSADEMRYDQWIASCRLAVADLHYTVEKQGPTKGKTKGEWMCIMRDDRRSRVDITVDRRTETICLTRIDVGVFGSEPTARLILATIRRRANLSAATQPIPNSDEIPEAPELKH